MTAQEELQTQQLEHLSAMISVLLRANFEAPQGGWPKPLEIMRPRGEFAAPATEKPKPKMASTSELVDFTIQNRVE